MPLRIICIIFLLVSAVAFPLYFTIAVGLFCIVWFRNFYEAIPLAFLNDALYGLPMERFHGFPYVMTLVTAALVLASVLIRRQLFDAHPHTL